MALSPDEKFIYINPDSSGEYNTAQYFPVKYLRGLECAVATHFYIYFRGPKDATSTRITVNITSGFIKDFFTQFVDEVNFGENAVITLADRKIATDATTGGTDFQHVNAFVAPVILSDVNTSGREDVQVAEDLDIGGDTVISGTLTMGSTVALTDAGLVAVANQSNITGVGTISSGVWQGTAIASAYLDSDTAHLSTTQTFTGAKTFSSSLTATGSTAITQRTFSVTSNTDGNFGGDVVFFGGTTSMTIGTIYHYKSDGTWEQADANAVATSDGLLGVALGAASNTNGMLLRGMVTLDHDPGAVGDVLFLSTTAGDATATAPSGNNDIVRVIGYCLNASNGQIWFNPDSTFVEVTA